MEHRIGICASCEANYTIPASFEHDQARCRECGGTVEIGPVVSGEPDAPSGELEEYVPSGKKRSGPSMMEQLRARRAEESGEAAAEEAPAEAAPAKPARKSAGKKASPRKSGAGARKSKASGSSSKSSKKASGGKRGSASKGKSGGRSSKRSSPEKKKGSAGMLIGVGGIVVLLGAGGYFFKDDLFGTTPTVDAAADADAKDTPTEGDDSAMADKTMPEKDMPAKDMTDASTTETKAEDKSASMDTAAKEEPKAAVDPSAPKNPDDVDLSIYGDYEPVDGTTEEFFAELEARMVRAMSPDIGIAQTKEWKFLGEHPRKAFPVVLNHLLKIDLSTLEGNEQGKWAVRILENNTGGNNFGWKEFEEDAEKAGPRYHEWFNKKVIIGWCKAWNKAEKDLNQWKGLAKLTDSQFEKLKRSLGDAAPEPSALDLLNDD